LWGESQLLAVVKGAIIWVGNSELRLKVMEFQEDRQGVRHDV